MPEPANPSTREAPPKTEGCGVYCGTDSTMQTVQIVLDSDLLRAADRAARQAKVNRSALVRDALRRHLAMLEIRSLEERDRRGYSDRSQATDNWSTWEREAAWPEA